MRLAKLIPWDDVFGALDAMAEAGWEKDAALDEVAALLDKALPLDELVPAPAGTALEAADYMIIRALLGVAWAMAENAEARRARRKARRSDPLAKLRTRTDRAGISRSE